MKTKGIIFLAMFSFSALLFLGSCSKETREALDCVRNPDDCYDDENSRELQGVIEMDSTAAVLKLPVKG